MQDLVGVLLVTYVEFIDQQAEIQIFVLAL